MPLTPPMLPQISAFLTRRRTEIRHAVRVAVAVGVAYTVAQLLNLPQGWWSVITAVVVVQTSIGGTLSASRDRLIGTVFGAAVGGLAAAVRPPGLVSEGLALALCVGLLTLAASIRPSLKVAPVTAVIMLISAFAPGHQLEAAGLRVAEIALGGVVGVLTTLLVFPAPAREAVSARLRSTLDELAQVLRLRAVQLVSGDQDEPVLKRQQKIRAGLTALEAAVGESSREATVRLTGRPVDEAVPRTLWRLRNDTVMLGRAIEHGWTPEARAALAGPAAALMNAQADALEGFVVAVETNARLTVPDLSPLAHGFRQAVERLDQSAPGGHLPFDTLRQVFALAYGLDSFNRNLTDLAGRLDEFVRSRRG